MKKAITLALLALSVAGFAQTSANTNVTINVSEIYSIVVDDNVVLNLATQADFLNGVQSVGKTVNIFATNGYKVTAHSNSANFSSATATATNPTVSNLEVNNIALSTTATDIFTSNTGTLGTIENLVYEIPSSKTVNFLNINEPLTTIITYTILAN